jgi:hypothetical protein
MSIAAMLVAASLAAGTGPNPVQTENSLGGTQPSEWLQPATPPTSIEGWASEISVLPGEQVHLHVSTRDGDRYTVELYRLGWYGGLGARRVTCLPSCGGDKTGQHFGASIQNGLIRADWPVTDTLTIPATAVSGYYYVLLRVTSGGDDTGARGYVAFVVRDPPSRRSQILVQVPVNTWQAYNPWGGKSLYPFNSTDMVPATRVSFDRPLAFTAQGPFDWEYNMVRFLEREGYDVSYQTDLDTDARPASLLDHRLVIVNGHDEYWTKQMRDAFNSARNAGTNLAFLGSNAAYWQVRYEDGRRTIVGYKDAAPDPEPNPALKTIRFRSLSPPRPECALIGVMFLRLREHQSGPVDYTVTNAAPSDAWFAGTGFHAGDTVLDIVGNEWDSLPDPPPPATCVKPQLKVLFHFEGQPANADAVRYTATSGARVFAGGAQQLSWALDTFNLTRFGRTLPPDTRFQQFMRNALADLTRPARPTALQVQVQGRTVTLKAVGHADPRIKFQSFKHAGPAPFTLTSPGVSPLCKNKTGNCVIRNATPGTYRYAAVTVDEWGQSLPIFTAPVVVPPAQ